MSRRMSHVPHVTRHTQHMSHAACHISESYMSHVTCHMMSHVTCHMSHVAYEMQWSCMIVA